MVTDSVKVGKIYRMKPNAQIDTMPQVVIVKKIYPRGEVQFAVLEELESNFHCNISIFRSRYFEITEDWHMQGL
jgi:hypothetical protein